MHITSTELRESLNNPATSYWLQEALQKSDQRDVIDFLFDVSLLKEYLQKKADEIGEYYLTVENGKLVAHNQ